MIMLTGLKNGYVTKGLTLSKNTLSCNFMYTARERGMRHTIKQWNSQQKLMIAVSNIHRRTCYVMTVQRGNSQV